MDVVLVDKVSLLSLQVIAEINSVLQFAKEEPGLWFGDVIVIFPEDFFSIPLLEELPYIAQSL